jgi:hypothetical protein
MKWTDAFAVLTDSVPVIVDKMLADIAEQFPRLQPSEMALIRDMTVHSVQQSLTYMGETLERNCLSGFLGDTAAWRAHCTR